MSLVYCRIVCGASRRNGFDRLPAMRASHGVRCGIRKSVSAMRRHVSAAFAVAGRAAVIQIDSSDDEDG